MVTSCQLSATEAPTEIYAISPGSLEIAFPDAAPGVVKDVFAAPRADEQLKRPVDDLALGLELIELTRLAEQGRVPRFPPNLRPGASFKAVLWP